MNRFEEAVTKLNDAACVVPKPGYWGAHMEITDEDAFYWFEDKSHFVENLRLMLDWLNGGHDPDPDDLAYVNKTLDKFEKDEIDSEELRKQLNDRFESEFDVLWCGLFTELVSGNDQDPKEVRHNFWEEWAEENEDEYDGEEEDPIPDQLINEFAEWLTGWPKLD